MKQTYCYLVVYIKKRGNPEIFVHMNEQDAIKEITEFKDSYEKDPILRQAYLDFYIETAVIE